MGLESLAVGAVYIVLGVTFLALLLAVAAIWPACRCRRKAMRRRHRGGIAGRVTRLARPRSRRRGP